MDVQRRRGCLCGLTLSVDVMDFCCSDGTHTHASSHYLCITFRLMPYTSVLEQADTEGNASSEHTGA